MVLLDSTIFIYIAAGTLPVSLIRDVSISYASITRIEALGYHQLTMPEMLRIEAICNEAHGFELSERVIEQAIQLRQLYNTSLGDSIVCATALVHDLDLWTHNVRDFSKIHELKLYDPLAG